MDNLIQPRTKVTIELPINAAKILVDGFNKKDPKLLEFMKEFGIVSINPVTLTGDNNSTPLPI